MKPETKGKTDCREGWSIENEIAWLEHYIELNQYRLKLLYAEREWWVRFLNYCNSTQ